MSELVREMLADRPDMQGVRLTYGVTTALNTVPIDGAATATPCQSLIGNVPAGVRVAVAVQDNADPAIVGIADGLSGPFGIMLERSTVFSVSTGGNGDTITWGTSEAYLYHRPGSGNYKIGTADIITIPTGLGGVYQVLFSGEFDPNATGVRQIWVEIGSNTTSGDEFSILAKQPGSLTLDDRMIASAAVLLDDGATLTAKAYQNSGAALDFGQMRFQALRLSA